MDGQFWITLLKILVFFPFIIALILILGKVGSKFNLGTNTKYMKVLERLPLSKDNSLVIVKIGEKAYLMSSSSGKAEILRELETSELEKVSEINALNLQQINNTIEGIKVDFLKPSKIISKFNFKKSTDD
ncbi:flagellar biosynthetic protein FliO [Clostridium tunisiense]|uniref:flagellar biosynthetic protein FliO n=1 Tax=Clostridium tunisiense TaxID=219748 RepID=UPI0002F27C2C|nr:flagellar biosynthetic protein FliO [Clostridium tunisiense]